jgi:hypothetical protein
MYDYDQWKLFVSYGIAILGTLFMTIVGSVSFYINGVSHNASFSAIMSTTRNSDLDHITRGQSLGRPELRPELEGTKLRFGVGEEVAIGNRNRARRLTFGLKGRVGVLRKGEIYI